MFLKCANLPCGHLPATCLLGRFIGKNLQFEPYDKMAVSQTIVQKSKNKGVLFSLTLKIEEKMKSKFNNLLKNLYLILSSLKITVSFADAGTTSGPQL